MSCNVPYHLCLVTSPYHLCLVMFPPLPTITQTYISDLCTCYHDNGLCTVTSLAINTVQMSLEDGCEVIFHFIWLQSSEAFCSADANLNIIFCHLTIKPFLQEEILIIKIINISPATLIGDTLFCQDHRTGKPPNMFTDLVWNAVAI